MKLRLGTLFAFTCALALMLFCLCGCSQVGNTAESESDEALPELKIGIDTLKPFMYLDHNGEYTGIDADIATEACKRAGFTPVFVEIPWAERDSYLENGTVDCLWTAFAQDGREDDYEWTAPYLNSKEAFLVEQRSPSTCLEDFKGPGGVAVRANSKAEELLLNEVGNRMLETTTVHAYGTFDMAETAFVKAYANGLTGHRIVLQELIDETPDKYRFLDDDIATLHLAVAFAKGDTDYRNRIDSALSSMKEDGAISTIVAKYDKDSSAVEVSYDKQ